MRITIPALRSVVTAIDASPSRPAITKALPANRSACRGGRRTRRPANRRRSVCRHSERALDELAEVPFELLGDLVALALLRENGLSECKDGTEEYDWFQ